MPPYQLSNLALPLLQRIPQLLTLSPERCELSCACAEVVLSLGQIALGCTVHAGQARLST